MDHSDQFFPNMKWVDNDKLSLDCLRKQMYLSCCPYVVKQAGRLKSLKSHLTGAYAALYLS